MSLTEFESSRAAQDFRVEPQEEKGPDPSELQDRFDPVQRQALADTKRVPQVVDHDIDGEPDKKRRSFMVQNEDGSFQTSTYDVTFHNDARNLPISPREDFEGHLIRLTGATIKSAVDYQTPGGRTYRVLHMGHNFQAPGIGHVDNVFSGGQEQKAHGYFLPTERPKSIEEQPLEGEQTVVDFNPLGVAHPRPGSSKRPQRPAA